MKHPSRLWNALTRNRVATGPAATDPRLRGRAYPYPFIRVWETAVALCESLPRWTLIAADPRAGEIQAEARTRWADFTDDVRVRVSLDERGRTRVDLVSASRVGRADLGTNARRVARFLRALDAELNQNTR